MRKISASGNLFCVFPGDEAPFIRFKLDIVEGTLSVHFHPKFITVYYLRRKCHSYLKSYVGKDYMLDKLRHYSG